ncbi:acyltransferase family protein [Sphingomonas desiccabilis]|uniref:Acyltransferase n=1 Tax=Sphingomonas desiccabilis TaxID=429134 RepID=A0A4Q2IVE1_9SPHN|nr:acyltransferase [Sphingomonas desiccabilis]MBB3912705.1 peptidoglycan/LPS O-acetylase OafA/YrhL [Sphingomonas desiccabilis]RXZ34669.1 acyltransferase [Sphingomonas desiccabilis]
MSTMKYRADIDGMRAIAVTSVILAHAGVTAVSGGFLGVDIFFVISGYLITTILRRDMADSHYTLLGFYERRARRIMPALMLVLACCMPFALWLMLPDFLQNFGQSVVATLLFCNNLLLAKTSGYWELESGFKPLLHTWSLGVEEQFYLVFPLFLVAIWRLNARQQLAAILLLGAVSFAVSEHGWRTYPAASFYLPTSRAWELMAGCAASYAPRRERVADNAVSLVSLLMLVMPMFILDEHTPSPSIYAAVPVIGAVGVLLFSRPGTIAFRLLSLRPIVFIGLTSYSAYLWHQPLFAFARVASLTPPGAAELAGLVLLTFLLATLTWRFVETPFRSARMMSLRLFAPIVGLATAALIACGLLFHVAEGFPRWTYPNISGAGDVYIDYNERIRKYDTSVFPADGRPNIVLIGNSFARDFGNVLAEAGILDRVNFAYIYSSPDLAKSPLPAGKAGLLRSASLVIVALSDPEPDRAAALIADNAQVLAPLTKAPPVYIGSKNFGYNINPFGRVSMAERPHAFAAFPAEQQAVNEQLQRTLPPADYLNLLHLLGPDGRKLRFYDDRGNPMTPDRRHLTRFGAAFLAERLHDEQPPAWRRIVAVAGQSGGDAPRH